MGSNSVIVCDACGASLAFDEASHDYACLSCVRSENDRLEIMAAEGADRLRAEVSRYRTALADAIRRPMGVIPDSADGLLTQGDLEAAEARTLEMVRKRRAAGLRVPELNMVDPLPEFPDTNFAPPAPWISDACITENKEPE